MDIDFTVLVFFGLWITLTVWSLAIQCVVFSKLNGEWWELPAFITCALFIISMSVFISHVIVFA